MKMLFVAFLAITNIIGVKAASRVNDFLTVVKLAPLIFFSAAGIVIMALNPVSVSANFTPFAPFGLSNFGSTLILIFWAYAGFELSTIPAEEIKDSTKTIPRAIILGISIVTAFYLVTNAILFGVRSWTLLATDQAPLATANLSMLSSMPTLALFGGFIVGIGALVSVAGSDESAMLGTSRLGYALALDGLFPKQFAEVHSRYKTPYLGILIQSATALAASILSTLGGLIATSVLFLSIAYFATCVSIYFFRKKLPKPKFILRGGLLIPILGAVFSLYLLSQCSWSNSKLALFF
jgi:amino acid transporter